MTDLVKAEPTKPTPNQSPAQDDLKESHTAKIAKEKFATEFLRAAQRANISAGEKVQRFHVMTRRFAQTLKEDLMASGASASRADQAVTLVMAEAIRKAVIENGTLRADASDSIPIPANSQSLVISGKTIAVKDEDAVLRALFERFTVDDGRGASLAR